MCFSRISRGRLARRTRSSSRPCSARIWRKASAFHPSSSSSDLKSSGQRARYAASLDDIVTTIAKERKDGDLVVFMSNGGFGGIHQKTLQALGMSPRRIVGDG